MRHFIEWMIYDLTRPKILRVPEPMLCASQCSKDLSEEERILEIIIGLAENISPSLHEAARYLADFVRVNGKEDHMRYWAISDMTLHSSRDRLYIFDVIEKKVYGYPVAHGKNSDKKFKGWCETVSNEIGSLQTSRGVYRCSELYTSLKFGKAMRLDGLESSNSNARTRAIVAHGAKYASPEYIKQNKKCGRSEGCQAFSFIYLDEIVDKLKDGSLLLVWHKERE